MRGDTNGVPDIFVRDRNAETTTLIVNSIAGSAPVANFTGTPRSGTVPLTVSFTDESAGLPAAWNWSFGDGNLSTDRDPVHTYEIAGDYTITLNVTKGSQSGNLTMEDYVYAETPGATFDASLILNSMPTTMFQGEHYLVDIKMNNTGSKKWFGDPTSPNHISLKGLGGPSGDDAASSSRVRNQGRYLRVIMKYTAQPGNRLRDIFLSRPERGTPHA